MAFPIIRFFDAGPYDIAIPNMSYHTYNEAGREAVVNCIGTIMIIAVNSIIFVFIERVKIVRCKGSRSQYRVSASIEGFSRNDIRRRSCRQRKLGLAKPAPAKRIDDNHAATAFRAAEPARSSAKPIWTIRSCVVGKHTRARTCLPFMAAERSCQLLGRLPNLPNNCPPPGNFLTICRFNHCHPPYLRKL